MYVRYYIVVGQDDVVLGCTEAVFLGLVALSQPRSWSNGEKRKEPAAEGTPARRRDGSKGCWSEEKRADPHEEEWAVSWSRCETSSSREKGNRPGMAGVAKARRSRECGEWAERGVFEKGHAKMLRRVGQPGLTSPSDRGEREKQAEETPSRERELEYWESTLERVEASRVLRDPVKWTVQISVAAPARWGRREPMTPEGELEGNGDDRRRIETVGIIADEPWWPE